MDADGVAGGEDLIQIRELHAQLIRHLLIRIGIIGQDLAFKSGQELGQAYTDIAKAQDTDALAQHLMADVLFPDTGLHDFAVEVQLPAGCQDMGQGHLRDTGLVGAGGTGNGDAMGTGCLQVYRVKTYAETDQQFAAVAHLRKDRLPIRLYIDQAGIRVIKLSDDILLIEGKLGLPDELDIFGLRVRFRFLIQLYEHIGFVSEERN